MKLSVLEPEGILRIDEAARRILDRTGVEIPHEEMLKLFGKAGAAIDKSNCRVRIPSPLVDDCLRSAGKTFVLYGRDRGSPGFRDRLLRRHVQVRQDRHGESEHWGEASCARFSWPGRERS